MLKCLGGGLEGRVFMAANMLNLAGGLLNHPSRLFPRVAGQEGALAVCRLRGTRKTAASGVKAGLQVRKGLRQTYALSL